MVRAATSCVLRSRATLFAATSLGVAVLAACAASSQSTTHRPPPRLLSSCDACVDASIATLCDRIRPEQDRALALLQSETDTPEDQISVNALVEAVTPLAHVCTASARGAWALVLGATSPHPRMDMQSAHVKIAIVHIAPSGESFRSSDEYEVSLGASHGTVAVDFFDFDDDGRDEVIVTQESHPFEEESSKDTQTLTLTSAKIAPYPPAKGVSIAEVRDVDGDRRLDILSPGPFVTRHNGCCSDPRGIGTTSGPLLLWHAKPDGTFSVDDPVAIEHARKQCEAAQELSAEAFVDIDLIATHAACDRMRGKSAKEIVAKFSKLRAQASTDCSTETCTSADEAMKVVRAFAAITAPLKIP